VPESILVSRWAGFGRYLCHQFLQSTALTGMFPSPFVADLRITRDDR
jgi:hypothetical protein